MELFLIITCHLIIPSIVIPLEQLQTLHTSYIVNYKKEVYLKQVIECVMWDSLVVCDRYSTQGKFISSYNLRVWTISFSGSADAVSHIILSGTSHSFSQLCFAQCSFSYRLSAFLVARWLPAALALNVTKELQKLRTQVGV